LSFRGSEATEKSFWIQKFLATFAKKTQRTQRKKRSELGGTWRALREKDYRNGRK